LPLILEEIRVESRLQDNLVGVANFECKEKKECFDAIESSINEIAEEEVISFRAFSAYFEQLHQIVELAVDVATNLKGKHR
jgi:hypothetical protein